MSELTVVSKDGLSVVEFNYDNNVIDYVLNNDYFNGTAMAKTYGKELHRWLDTTYAAEDIFLTALDLGIITEHVSNGVLFNTLTSTEKVKYVKQYKYFGLVKLRNNVANELRGTFIHRELAVSLAQWLDPRFRRQVSKWITELVNHGKLILDSNEAALFEQYKQSHQLLLEQESANVRGIPIAPRNEGDLAFRIKNWIDLCTDGGRFYIEHPLINTINAATKTRRVDFVKSNGRNVIVYELKLNKITTSDIAKTIGDKGYYQLCADKFNRPIKFIFLSPLGITNEAQLLLDRMNDVSFLTTQQLCQEYYVKGKKNKWRSSEWYLDVQVKDDKFSHLFTDEFIDDVTVKLTKVK
jgi:hypothetical protein